MMDRILKLNDKFIGMFENYESFILSNVSQVNAIENALRTLTYILPGRFGDAELASEALYSILNLVGLYHDKILTKVNKKEHEESNKNLFNKYTKNLINSSPLYKQFAYALSFVEYTQVLLEMLYIKKNGQKGKFKLISLIELVKMLLRLALFKLSKNRYLLSPPHPEREKIDFEESLEYKNKAWQGKRTGYKHTKVNNILMKNNVNNFLISKMLDKNTARKTEYLVSELFGYGQIAELVYILRPFLYVCALRKFGIKSWKPWLMSLSLETLSYQLHKKYGVEYIGENNLSDLELDERKRRKNAMAYYLLKNPFFDRFTKSFMLAFCDFASNKFLISFFAGILKDYIPLWENYYFYSTSE